MPIFREDLAAMETCCSDPTCPGLSVVLSSRCHTGAPTFAVFRKTTGVLELLCCVCETPVATVAVALRSEASPPDVDLTLPVN